MMNISMVGLEGVEQLKRNNMQLSPKKVKWPYDNKAAKNIDCYLVRIPWANLYIYRSNKIQEQGWHYTLSAGKTSERSHSGYIPDVEDFNNALNRIIISLKKLKVWSRYGEI